MEERHVKTIRRPRGLESRRKRTTVGGFVIAKASQAETKTAEVIAVGEGVRTPQWRVGSTKRQKPVIQSWWKIMQALK